MHQRASRLAAAAAASQLSILAINQNCTHRRPLHTPYARVFKRHVHSIKRHLCAHLAARHDTQAASAAEDSAAAAASAALQDALQRWLRVAAALLATTCLHLGSAYAAEAMALASASEDRLLGVVRAMETQFDAAWTLLRTAAPAPAVSPDSQDSAARDLIEEVYEVVERNFSDARGAGFDATRWRAARDAALSKPLPDAAAAHSAVRTMLAYLKDPYSRFITPTEFSAMAKYDVSGVGLNLGTLEDLRSKTGLEPAARGSGEGDGVGGGATDSGSAWVVGIIRGSASETAGMRQGDQVVAVDGSPLGERSPFEVASLLAGPDQPAEAGGDKRAAASVIVRVRHLDGTAEDLTLVRPHRQPTPSPVTYKLEQRRGGGSPSVGVIRLSSFNAKAQRDVAAAVRSAEAAGAQRLVLDLRGNRGGLVTEGVEVARLFLDSDNVVVRTAGRGGMAAATAITAPGPAASTAPMAILVDSHTASASEIVAGALQDNCRAVLVGGSSTYGKGLIQSVYELGDGSGLVLTVGKYLTPNFTDIDWRGISPDFGSLPGPEAADKAIAACRLRAN